MKTPKASTFIIALSACILACADIEAATDEGAEGALLETHASLKALLPSLLTSDAFLYRTVAR
jgi:hypothetical protein